MVFKKVFLILSCIISLTATAQQVPFGDEIQKFKQLDKVKLPPANAILFVGSSTIRLWPDLQQAFPNHVVIQRGFGGSELKQVIHYADDIIFPYRPKQVVIYCGENDLAYDSTKTAESILNDFKQLHGMIREKLPTTNIAYISMKPSPSRESIRSKVIEGNQRIASFISKQPNTIFIDTYSHMFNTQGKVRTELFTDDMLHMSKNGYAVWQKIIEPYLLK